MFEMGTNHKLLLKKLDEVVEENKFWKDLFLEQHTPTSTKSGHIPPSTTSITLPTNLQDFCDVPGKNFAKKYDFVGSVC